jgi:hypothetical protein
MHSQRTGSFGTLATGCQRIGINGTGDGDAGTIVAQPLNLDR